jgi:phosphoribosylaminoimidazole-succinocarboxamide synthase
VIYVEKVSGNNLMSAPVFETQLPGLKLMARGKVRDVYDLGDKLLIVSTDRLSAFDCVLPTPIPDKGKVLNGLSRFWFSFLGDTPKNHLITTDVNEMGHGLEAHRETLAGRSMLTVKAKVFPVECVVRGYLMGSGWKEYQEKGSVCGIALQRGLTNGSKLDQPIFTPATKAQSGHDQNISFEQACEAIGQSNAEKLRELSLSIYQRAAAHALTRNIIIADTKFEFGVWNNEIILVDEVLTPDSSRFWPKQQWTPGQTQLSYDKQFVRDYLEGIGWNKQPPAPPLPETVVMKTREKYVDAYRQITGNAEL